MTGEDVRIGDPTFQEEAYRAVALKGVEDGYWQLEVRLPEDFTKWEDPEEGPLHWCNFMTYMSAATEYKLREAVRWARQSGHSWEQIGEAIGMTRQSAWQRFGPDE